jgi:hypothetical protein
MRRAFSSDGVVAGKEKTQGATAASIAACRLQSEMEYISYHLMHWQEGIKIHDLDPGNERDRLVSFFWENCN